MLKKFIKNILGEYWIFRLKEGKDIILNRKSKTPAVDASLYQDLIKPGDLCFDVGANVGNKVDLFLKIGAKVVAIEPQENCYRILKYKYGNNIDLVKKGLGDAVGIKQFHISNSSTISSFSKEWIESVKQNRFKNYSWSKTLDIEMTTLDKLIQLYGDPVFIKIDVEGYELEVLKGLTQSVNLISFEYTVPERIERIFECLNYIENLNPNIVCNFTIGENMKLTLMDWIPIDEMRRYVKSESFPKDNFGDIYVKVVAPHL